MLLNFLSKGPWKLAYPLYVHNACTPWSWKVYPSPEDSTIWVFSCLASCWLHVSPPTQNLCRATMHFMVLPQLRAQWRGRCIWDNLFQLEGKGRTTVGATSSKVYLVSASRWLNIPPEDRDMIVRNLLLAIGSLPGNRTYMNMLVAVIEFQRGDALVHPMSRARWFRDS